MKNFSRLSLLAAVVATLSTLSVSAIAATATGQASATVLTPITISPVTPLNFGTLAGNASGGTVNLTAAGLRTTSGTVVVTPAAFSVASFKVDGTGGQTFAVSYPPATPSLTVTNGTVTMAFTVVGQTSGTLSAGAAGTLTFPVGGTLTVGASQAAGTYTGTYPMTVEYN